MNNPGASDNHGCPFKHRGKEALRSALLNSNWGINKMGNFFDRKRVGEALRRVDDIVTLAGDKHHQIACSKWMESRVYVQTGQIADIPPTEHPNGYSCTMAGLLENKK
eukprot:NODE_4_length_55019_cov_0.425091.p38 type:complete len:108 gc:universal NODE_4_length_55019_cov_0.425091:48100-48423(+)